MIKDVRQFGARLANSGKTKPQLQVEADVIRELSDLLGETGLTEIEIEQGGRRIRVARQNAPHMSAPPLAVSAVMESAATSPSPHATPGETQAPKRDVEGAITSPMVGTVYVSPEPGKPPFVKAGDTVKEGDTLLIVEAMKTMNPIAAPRAGTVTEIMVRDAQPVEFGQTLLVLS